MKLVLHIGKNKVGSSTLQSFLCSHYNYLLTNNIFYPLHKNPKNKFYGSVGNALDLSFALKYKSWFYIKFLFDYYYRILSINKYNILMLSNESIFHNLLDEDVFNRFTYIIKSCGFTSCQILIFDKDNFNHSISCYNHRIGTTIFLPYDLWIENNLYEGYTENIQFHSLENTFNNNFVTITKYHNTKDVITDFLNIFSLKLPKLNIEQKNKSITTEHGFILGKLSIQSKFFTAYLKLYLKQNNKCKISNFKNSFILDFYYDKYSKSFRQTEEYTGKNKNIIHGNYKNIYNIPINYLNLVKTFFIIFKYYINKSCFFSNLFNSYYLIKKFFKLFVLKIVYNIY